MRRIVIDDFNAAPRLETPTGVPPAPGPGEVALEVHACGLNFADLLMIEGKYQEPRTPPYTPGMEMSGVVRAVGEGVPALAPGMRVAAFAGHGGMADAAVVPAELCVALPDSMSHVDAAAFQVAYGTSHLALWHRAALVSGETLVVLGAAGGVGLSAVELGKLMGARVIAVARGADKLAVAAAAGADHLVDSDAGDLRAELRALGGADVVYDPVGGDAFTAALRATRPGGRMLVIGFASGTVPQIPANILLVKNIAVHGFYWSGSRHFAPGPFRDSLTQLFAWHSQGLLRPHVSHVLPLEQAAEGLELLRSRASTGKVVIALR